METIGGNNARGITKAAVTAAAADTIIGVTAALLTTADARWGGWHGGGWHGGGWHVGGWRSGGWGWGFAPGFALGLGLGAAPYYAYGGPYYGAYAYVRDAPAGRDQPLGSSRMEMGARLLLNISTD